MILLIKQQVTVLVPDSLSILYELIDLFVPHNSDHAPLDTLPSRGWALGLDFSTQLIFIFCISEP